MNNIKSYVRFLDIFCKFVLIPLMVLAFMWKWTRDLKCVPHFISTWSSVVSYSWESNIESMPILSRLLGMLVDSVSYGLIVLGFFYFLKLLQCYREGELFSLEIFSLFRKLSRIAFAFTIYEFVSYILMSLISTLHNPPGERMIAVRINSSDVNNIFIVGCFLVITSIMYEGYKLKKDQDLTV